MSLEPDTHQSPVHNPTVVQEALPDSEEAAPQGIRSRLLAIGLYVALSVGLYFVLAPIFSDPEHLGQQLEAAGVLGIIAYLVLYSAQMFVPWLPGLPLDMIGGATFGFWETTILSTISASSCGLVIYLAVRRVSLERIVAHFPGLLESPWRLVQAIKKQPWSLIAVNMLTGDVAYFVAGAVPLPLLFTMIVLGVMRIPSVMLGTAVGAGIISQVLREQLDILVTVGSIGTIITLSIGFIIARKYLPGWMERLESPDKNNTADS